MTTAVRPAGDAGGVAIGTRAIERWLFVAFFATLGTYAIPSLRLGGAGGQPYAVAVAVLLFGIVAVRIAGASGAVDITPVLGGLTLLMAVSGSLATSLSEYPNFAQMVKYLMFMALLVLLPASAQDERLIERAIRAWLVVGFLVFLYGVYGFVTWRVGEITEHALGYFAITYTGATRNGDMLYLQAPLWALIGLVFFGPRPRHKWIRAACMLAIVMLAGGIVMSLSRGAWISTSCAFLAVLLLSRGRRRHGAGLWFGFAGIAVLLVIGVAIYAGPTLTRLVTDRASTIFSLSAEGGNSNAPRLLILDWAFAIFARHPWGVGFGSMPHYLHEFPLGVINHAENAYMQLAAEGGFVATFALIGVIAWILAGVGRWIRAHEGHDNVWVGWALLGLTIDWTILAGFNNLLEHMWWWCGLGLAAGLASIQFRRVE